MMKKKVLSLVIVTVFCFLTFLIPGCSMNRVDLVDAGRLSLEPYNTGKVYIAWSGAYEQDNGFVVSGVLRRRDSVGAAIRTHVDVTVLSPDGTILDEARTSDVYVARRIPGRGYLSFERFKVCLADIPVTGSSVRLVSHSSRHN
ncbi:MAG: hypothetical protein GY845_37875 [Planctomycetes bacterium]|nr:hypothetical protein [Planctomycetota bacterium]